MFIFGVFSSGSIILQQINEKNNKHSLFAGSEILTIPEHAFHAIHQPSICPLLSIIKKIGLNYQLHRSLRLTKLDTSKKFHTSKILQQQL